MVFRTGWGSFLGLIWPEPIIGAQIENLPDQEAEEQDGDGAHNSGGAAILIVEYKNKCGSHRHNLDC